MLPGQVGAGPLVDGSIKVRYRGYDPRAGMSHNKHYATFGDPAETGHDQRLCRLSTT